MKKFLLVLSVIFSFAALQKTSAQCTVSDIVVTPKTFTPGGTLLNPTCTVTVDVAFTASTNNGNKRVYFHVWKTSDYPNAAMVAEYGTCTGNQSVADAPVREDGGSGEIDVLDNAFLNYGFNINDILTTFSATGLFADYATYDATVPLNTAGTLIKKQNISADLDRIFIQNLTFVVPNYICGDPLNVTAFLWATNSTGSKPQCWSCGIKLLFNDPVIDGFVNCGALQRTFNLNISTQSTVALDGDYKVYLDNAPLNSFGPEDYQTDVDPAVDPVASGSFTGLITGVAGTKSYFNQTYIGNNVAVEANKSLWVEVKITTPGIQANAVVKLIGNNCSPLPVKLKNFNASKKVGKVAVTWETEEEINSDGFEIQRRIGNGKYETIAFVDSKAPNGNGSNYTYSYDDAQNLPNGVTYYRLRQIDFDGKSMYSDIKAVRSNSKAFVVSVYPNPNRGTTNVAIPEGVGTVDASLEDFTGKLIQRWNSLNTRNLQLTNLKPGIYMLRITVRETGDQVVERILVQ